MSEEKKKFETELARRKRVARIAAIVGMLLALVCHSVPPQYRAICDVVAQVAPSSCH